MDQFETLRKQAVQRRGKLMAAAREEYSTTLTNIDRLARLLGGKQPTAPYGTLRQAVIDCLPNDRCFTVGQLFELLEAKEPDRIFPIGSVRTCLHLLEKQGITKRIGRSDGNILWAVVGFEVDDPFGAQTVREVVGALIRELGPMTLEEMVIHLQGRGYKLNVPYAFGMQVNFAQLIKTYASTQEQTRYSPATITGIEKLPIFGTPDEDRISTSHIERFNLTLRMSSRRHTRLTNAHSKSLKHQVAMQAIVIAFYNFCRKHETLKGQTPAMASKLSSSVWTIKELLENAAEC